MKISVTGNSKQIIFELNNGLAAKELYEQLPLETKVENFSTNEKIFYPPSKLETRQTPMANAKKGTLAYYTPWGDVVMFYKDFGQSSGLYDLGQANIGAELIESLAGVITITKAE